MNLPEPSILKLRLQALATIDVLVCNQWDLRYFSFNSQWGLGEEVGSMRDGQGDDYFILFFDGNVAIKGCSKESKLSNNPAFLKTITAQLPSLFADFLNEPAFSIHEASFVYWREKNENWNKVVFDNSIDDGSDDLLSWIFGDSHKHSKWLKEYYDIVINESIITKIFNGEKITFELLSQFKYTGNITNLISELNEIGYPHSIA